MQKLGQHFLKNDAALANIVKVIAPADGDWIVEIGPGHGELTVPLLRAVQNKRFTVVCIEKDRSLAEVLRSLLIKETAGGNSTAIIQEGDALKLLPALVESNDHGKGIVRYKVVGNIPYYITGKLLHVLSELDRKPERVVLLIQKEVAERICAAPPKMNRLAASVQFWAHPAIVTLVPRRDFSPPPEVDSAIIALDKRTAPHKESADPAAYYRAVRAIFAQPRKTLLNNLAMAGAEGGSRVKIAERLRDIGLNPELRPQNLAVEQIGLVAKALLWG